MEEVAPRKIGEPWVYRDKIDILYPGEQARIRILVVDGEPMVTYFVGPIPGWRGRWLRLRWRVWGHWFAGPAQLRVRLGESWYEHVREEEN